ncbi:EscU/YscU/HrcU family type III secretion system export apparatus switch protein, partial [Acinetobacter baumannii]
VPNPPLARALYRLCEVGDNVPRELFQPVAEVLAYVYKTLKRIRQ